MSAPDTIGAAPDTREPRFWLLLFGCSAAPLLWLGQMMLNYGITSRACYPGDHPLTRISATPYFMVLLATDVIALAGCGATALIARQAWERARGARDRFLAGWGQMSSLWFFAAILFNLIASLMVPICPI